MRWDVTMEEDGAVTLPAELIERLGWTPQTVLRFTDEADGFALVAVGSTEALESE